MTRYIGRRLLQVPLPLLLISFVVFLLVHATGDPAGLYLGMDATLAERQVLREQMGLDQPLLVQYAGYLGRMLRGDMGYSLRFRAPALTVIVNHLPSTALLASLGLLLAAVLGVVIGVFSARARGSWADTVLVSLSVTGQSMPSFWLGIVLILLLAVGLRWLPTSGSGSWKHVIMPSITLASFILPHVAMLTRTVMLEVLPQQYIVTARGKGLPERRIMYTHALRNALSPLVAFFGVQFGQLMGGAVITETVFAWPGIGLVTIQSIFNRDAPVVVAVVLVLSLIIILCNLAADIANALLDPRIRIQ